LIERSVRDSEIPSFSCERWAGRQAILGKCLVLRANNPGFREGIAPASGAAFACANLTEGPGADRKPQQLTVSIIIKALNEEEHVAAAIESALAALGEIDGEVILADGGSSDRTIEIARRYPIGTVQLDRPEDRSCGSGAQLGFQYSRGRYLLLMDGDMRLEPGFLPVAIEALARSPGLAGVGGVVCEPVEMTEEYQQRRKRHNPDRRAGRVTRLDGSGLYRRAAIESIGYLTDRNLHAAEELDLGARLHSAGWTLVKLDRTMVYHEPHKASAYRLLLRHVFSRRAWAVGELIRAAIAKPHFWFILRHNRQWLVCLLVTAWWITLLATVALLPRSLAVLAAAAILLLPFAGMSLRWRSIRLGLYSVIGWNAVALCFWPGWFQSRIPPTNWIESTVLQFPKLDGDRPPQQSLSEFSWPSTVEQRGPERLET
jgi:glycosyltransferase involved in cell wall biosynthesis